MAKQQTESEADAEHRAHLHAELDAFIDRVRRDQVNIGDGENARLAFEGGYDGEHLEFTVTVMLVRRPAIESMQQIVRGRVRSKTICGDSNAQ